MLTAIVVNVSMLKSPNSPSAQPRIHHLKVQ